MSAWSSSKAASRFARSSAGVVGGVAQGLALAVAVATIVVIVASVYVLTTGSHLALPGVEVWAESYRDSPSVVYLPKGVGALAALVLMTTAFAVWRVRATLATDRDNGAR